MSTRELERDLAAVLHRRAEDAMNSTDTQAEHNRFYEVLETEPRDEQPRWVVGLVAAAAAVAVTSAIWVAIPDDPAVEPVPAPAPGEDRGRESAAESVAQQTADAFARRDENALNALTRVGAWDDLDDELLFAETWKFDYDVEPCVTTATTYVAVVVTCPATVDAAYSVDVGRGRFGDVVFAFVVRDDEVIDVGMTLNHDTSGLGDYMASVSDWMESHATPADRAFLEREPSMLPEAEQARSVRLRHQYLDAYLEDQLSKGDG